MLMLWWLAGAALFVALGAVWAARRTARRLDALTQAYWELRYDFTKLRGARAGAEGDGPVRAAPPDAPAGVEEASFVSLASLKKQPKAEQTGETGKAGG